MDEFRRIAEIRQRLCAAGVPAWVELGIGDDAAVLAPSAARQVLSVDASVEDVHFRLDWLSPEQIGFRALVAALSDLAAMGAKPRAALCAMIAPDTMSEAVLYGIADGVAQASTKYATPVVGGNLAAGERLSLTFTVIGECDGEPLTRGGARPGDDLFVTGGLGGAALGLAALAQGRAELTPLSVERWRRPRARIAEGLAAVGLATAAIDLSDGLLQDLRHICEASQVGAVLELERLPLAPELREHAGALDRDPLTLALCGGEDYELLLTTRGHELAGATRIGSVVAGEEVELRDAEGQRLELPASGGFQHF